MRLAHRDYPDYRNKENLEMSKRFLAFVAVLLLGSLGLSSTAAAKEPWWELTTSSRPTNLWIPQSELQEVKVGPGLTLILLEGAPVACMNSPECPVFFSLPNAETAAELQSSLEAAYGAGDVLVSEDPAVPGRLLIESVGGDAGRYVSPLTVIGGGGTSTATVITEGGSGRLVVTLTNIGDAPVDGSSDPVTLTDVLPEGVSAYHVEGYAGANNVHGPLNCSVVSAAEVTCAFEGVLPPFEALEVEIYASVTGEPPVPGGPGAVTASGGGAATVTHPQEVRITPDATPFGVESYSARTEEEGGAPATQAGSHPFQLTTTIQLNQGPLTPGNRFDAIEQQPAQPRNFRLDLPAGLVGNARNIPRCSLEQFTRQEEFVNECSDDSAIGVAAVTIIETNLGFMRLAVPVFNLEPAQGEPARFGFMAAGVPVTLDPLVRAKDGYRIQINVKNTSQLAQLLASTVTLWGTPGDPAHDESRGWNCAYAFASGPCVRSGGLEVKPFLRLPTSCQNPLDLPMELEPWNVPAGSGIVRASAALTPVDGCSRVPFAPTIEARTDTTAAESPAGLRFHLRVPQEATEVVGGIGESDVRDVQVNLPKGLQINPAGANGLRACTEAQVGFERIDGETGGAVFDEDPAACPDASKLGTVEIRSPLIGEAIKGSIYQAAQQANPYGSLLAFYVVADAPKAGVHLKLASKVAPTPNGLVSTVQQSPQLPFEDLEFNFFGGSQAPLATAGCGDYLTQTRITPWSGGAPATPSDRFEVNGGPHGSACSTPFSPSLVAGTELPIAGDFSPFALRIGRDDGMQQLGSIETVLPPGLIAKLKGISYCPEASIRQAEGRNALGAGRAEQAAPSCPPTSKVGTVDIASGFGPTPYNDSGHVFLAGPYKDAPLSLAVITPALAGPFDLGTVVVRVALYVNPLTTQVTAKSDQLPTSLFGIPLAMRSASLSLSRPSFTLNPTSCERMEIEATPRSQSGVAAVLTQPFQARACKALGFRPKFSLGLKGGTKRAQHPSLRATLKTRKGDANISRTVVTLPPGIQIDNAHIKTPCTRVKFEAQRCPKASILGRAKAVSPLLDKPLSGPVYFRSNGGERELPDLVADLHGQIHVVLVGFIDSAGGRIRTTFARVPDAPVSKFALDLKGGMKGLLVNGLDLCARQHRIRVAMAAHNGRAKTIHPALKTACGRRQKGR